MRSTATLLVLAVASVMVEAYEPGVGVCGPNFYDEDDEFVSETPCGHPDQGPRYLCDQTEYCSFYHPDGKLYRNQGYCCPTYNGNYPNAEIQCEKFTDTSCKLCAKTHKYGDKPYTCGWDGYNCIDVSIAPNGLELDPIKYPDYKFITDNRVCEGDVDYYQAFGDTATLLKFNGTCEKRCGEEGWAKFGLTEEEFNQRCGGGGIGGQAAIDSRLAQLVVEAVFNVGRVASFGPPPLSIFSQGGPTSYGNNYAGLNPNGFNSMMGPNFGAYGPPMNSSPYARQMAPSSYNPYGVGYGNSPYGVGYGSSPYGSPQQPYMSGSNTMFSTFQLQQSIMNALTFGGTMPIDTSSVQADGTVNFNLGTAGSIGGGICYEENMCNCAEDCSINGECCEDHKALCYTGEY